MALSYSSVACSLVCFVLPCCVCVLLLVTTSSQQSSTASGDLTMFSTSASRASSDSPCSLGSTWTDRDWAPPSVLRTGTICGVKPQLLAFSRPIRSIGQSFTSLHTCSISKRAISKHHGFPGHIETNWTLTGFFQRITVCRPSRPPDSTLRLQNSCSPDF